MWLQVALSFLAVTQLAHTHPSINQFSGVQYAQDNLGNVKLWQPSGFMEYNTPTVPDTRFSIASNSKLFTSVAIYQLQEAGLLNVSDNVAKYLTAADFAAFGHPEVTSYCPVLYGDATKTCQVVTFTELMSMGSGFIDTYNCDYPSGSPFIKFCQPNGWFLPTPTTAAVVGTFILTPLTFIPGTSYSYANTNFILLTYIIEKYSGKSFNDYILQHITRPLGLTATYLDRYDQSFGFRPNMSRGFWYFMDTDNPLASPYSVSPCVMELDPSVGVGTGGMVSTVKEMAHWYLSLFNRNASGAPLLKDPRSIAAIVGKWNKLWKDNSYNSSFSKGMYYSQGVITWYLNNAKKQWPDYIQYEGATVCQHTANILDLRDPNYAFVSIAYRNTNVVYMNMTTWNNVSGSGVGTFLQLMESLGEEGEVVNDALDVAWSVHNRFAAAPPEKPKKWVAGKIPFPGRSRQNKRP